MKGLHLVVLDKKIFLKIFLWKTYKPRGVAIFGPGVIIWSSLVEDHKVMLQTNMKGLGFLVSERKIFLDFPMKNI